MEIKKNNGSEWNNTSKTGLFKATLKKVPYLKKKNNNNQLIWKYMDSGFISWRPSSRDGASNWVKTFKKLTYKRGRRMGKLNWSKTTLEKELSPINTGR